MIKGIDAKHSSGTAGGRIYEQFFAPSVLSIPTDSGYTTVFIPTGIDTARIERKAILLNNSPLQPQR